MESETTSTIIPEDPDQTHGSNGGEIQTQGKDSRVLFLKQFELRLLGSTQWFQTGSPEVPLKSNSEIPVLYIKREQRTQVAGNSSHSKTGD